ILLWYHNFAREVNAKQTWKRRPFAGCLPLPCTPSAVLLEGCDVSIVLESKPDLVETFQQARSAKVVDFEAGSESLIVLYHFIEKRNMQSISFSLRAMEKLLNFRFRK